MWSNTLKHSFLSSEPRRFALFLGSLSLVWNFTEPTLRLIFPECKHQFRYFIAGALAGCSILAETYGKRIEFTQQLVVRSLQGSYNALKSRNIFYFPNGDALLFVLGTAQIMYAYVMHPTTLNSDFYNFMLKSAKIPDVVLREAAACAIRQPVHIDRLKDYIHGKFPHAHKAIEYVDRHLTPNPPVIPCEILHPISDSCLKYNTSLWWSVFKQIFVVYAPLNIVPLILLKYSVLLKK